MAEANLKKKERARSLISEYTRVLKLAKKPGRKEYSLTSKVTAIGIVLIGTIGYILKYVSVIIQNFGA
ncbi:MAG: preprotein translocase subunit SecE [Candidatus Methanofastidiosum methylothiophilum]|uniref:Protein translocase subunit SecE n=1 Tax=Candidatus Methanofastidiosum methylothiophilum TaxID=1705564 RepID=A0A150IHT9_9EURY|nr:MAG: preprotein translocase subunit SecE [Candidatus Methanofastidiosum methylthiophilus]KYC48658.1 MAG: preprotein translocase subunit SecE [Candidatus Methanofastidiosum methylthiophilus]KYC51137.1 MAG: preprotein translocase subunit SecE [Candidatus Methanofastidiosum methylthiophilus]